MASRDFFLKFEWRVWKSDPALRRCRPATRGIWMDLICAMCENDKCGTVTGTIAELAIDGGCSEQEMEAAIADLRLHHAADVHDQGGGVVSIVNRRMSNEYKRRETWRNTKKKQRSENCPTNVHEPSPKKVPSDYYSDCFVSSVVKGGAGGNGTTPPAPIGEPSPPASSGQRYNLRPIAVAAFSSLPKRVRRKQPAFEREFANAVASGKTPEFIAERLAAYYASPEGSGQWFREPANWLEHRGYDEPDETWQGREPAVKPKKKSLAEIEREAIAAMESAR